jgi:hypothetical protein
LTKGTNKCSIIAIESTSLNPSELGVALLKRIINTGAAIKNFAYIHFTQKQVEWALCTSHHIIIIPFK